MSIPLRRCSGKLVNQATLQELPILPFLAPRVFAPWPKSKIYLRAHGTAQVVQDNTGGEASSHDVSWPAVTVENDDARKPATEARSTWSVESGHDSSRSRSTAGHDAGQAPSQSVFRRRGMKHRRQSRNSGEKKKGWAVDNEIFRHAYGEIWGRPVAENRFQNIQLTADFESLALEDAGDEHTADESQASGKAIQLPMRSQAPLDKIQEQQSARATGHRRLESLAETDSVDRKGTYSMVGENTDSIVQKETDPVSREGTYAMSGEEGHSVVQHETDSVVREEISTVIREEAASVVRGEADSAVGEEINSAGQEGTELVSQDESHSVVREEEDSEVRDDTFSAGQEGTKFVSQEETDSMDRTETVWPEPGLGEISRHDMTAMGRDSSAKKFPACIHLNLDNIGPEAALSHDMTFMGESEAEKFPGSIQLSVDNVQQILDMDQPEQPELATYWSWEMRYNNDGAIAEAYVRPKDPTQVKGQRRRWELYRKRQLVANRLLRPVRTRYIRLAVDGSGQLNSLDLSWTASVIEMSSKYDRDLGGQILRLPGYNQIRRRLGGFRYYASGLINLSGASFQAKWASLTDQQRQEQWSDIMLVALEYYPESALAFLVATCKSPFPPSYAISDSLELITKHWLQEGSPKELNAAALLRTIISLQNHIGGNYLELTQNNIFLLLLHLNGEQAEEFYRTLTAAGNPLHENTLLQFVACLSKNQRTDCAVEALRRAYLAGTDFTKPQVESICATLLSRKSRQVDSRVSDSELFSMMLEYGLRPNIVFYNILLQNAADVGDPETSWSIHDIMVNNGIHPDAHTYSILLNEAKNRMDRETIEKIFDVVKSKQIVNAHIATDMLHAVFLLSETRAKGTGTRRSPIFFQRMLPLYCEYFDAKPLIDIAGLPMDQCQQFIPSEGRKIHPPKETLIVMLTALLREYTDSRSTVEFYDHFQALLHGGHPDVLQLVENSQLYDAVIMALGSNSKTLHLCTKVVGDMIAANPDTSKHPEPSTDLEVVNGANRKLRLSKEGRQHLESISAPDSESDLSPLVPWSPLSGNKAPESSSIHDSQASSSLIRDPASAAQEQLSQFASTDFQGISPNSTPRRCLPTVWTWSALLKAFMDNSQPRAAEEVLNMMRARGIEPNIVTWNTLAFGYARLQDVAATVDVIERFEKEGCVANDVTLKLLERIQNQQSLRARLGEKEKRAIVRTQLREDEKGVEEGSSIAEKFKRHKAAQQLELEQMWHASGKLLDERPIVEALALISEKSAWAAERHMICAPTFESMAEAG